MTTEPIICKQTRVIVYSVAILGTFVIMVVLSRSMVRHTRPAPVNAVRAAERTKAQRELRAAAAEVLATKSEDKTKGLVRLPIETAMKLVVERSANPAAFRSNLLARIEKATAAPPKAPEKPSAFE